MFLRERPQFMIKLGHFYKENYMPFSHIALRSCERVPPMGWKKTGYGYFQMEKVQSQEKIKRDKESHKASDMPNLKGEGYIEQQIFLNLIKSLKGHVNLFELGAGRGDWCLALAGIVDFNLIDHEITSYRCLAVEAEPVHFEWTKMHFEEQSINAKPIYGAVTSKVGECQFYSVVDPASNYGQSIRDDGNLKVPCYTVDYLMNKYKFDIVDILHSDVQGAEYDMILGATEALKKKAIKYMMIGTHKLGINEQIIDYVKPYGYEFLFSVNVHEGPCDSPFGKALFPVDGLLVLKC